jgi:hypothetical protein
MENISSELEHAEQHDEIPLDVFQRTFERLTFLLGETEAFSASEYDGNGNGYVGWGEFAYVLKTKRMKFKLCFPERIFLTFDNPESSHIAQILSVFVLLVICLSSVCFILSTTEEFQKDDPWDVRRPSNKSPEPVNAFAVIETVCLIIFVLEYIARLTTCWAYKPEVLDQARLMELVVGYEVIREPSPALKVYEFVTAPSNLVDLVAILPGVIGWFKLLIDPGNTAKEGGSFVVLRLVRLTRIFRAFKNPKLLEPVIVIAQTIQQSTKALYVLAFNLLLGILLSGSLMYLCEKGDWDPETHTYQRKNGRKWNSETYLWEDVKADSPFKSIPHAFWWAVVTATTVGYGDMFPTTSGGYAIAAVTMMYSLVILALPVGVISGNFTSVWQQYESNTLKRGKQSDKDKRFITSAIQRIDPFKMSRLLLIELWNERSPHTDPSKSPREGVSARPDNAEFMGEATLELDLPFEDAVQKTVVCKLQANTDICDREVQGTITIWYEWTPECILGGEVDTRPSNLSMDSMEKERTLRSQGHTCTFEEFPTLTGRLRLVLVEGHGLANSSWIARRQGISNPYAMVFCYPRSPQTRSSDTEIGATHPLPYCWRAPTERHTLSPKWNAGHAYRYKWRRPAVGDTDDCVGEEPKLEDLEQSAKIRTLPRLWKEKTLRETSVEALDAKKDAPVVTEALLKEHSTQDSKTRPAEAEGGKAKRCGSSDVVLVQCLKKEIKNLRKEVSGLRERLGPAAGFANDDASRKQRQERHAQPHLQALQLNTAATAQGSEPMTPLPHTLETLPCSDT